MNERTVTRSRQSKRKRNADQASSRLLLDNQLDWCQPCYADAPVTPIDEDAVQAIHDASMTILENLGVLFLNDAALSIFERPWLSGRMGQQACAHGSRLGHGTGGKSPLAYYRNAAKPGSDADLWWALF